VESIKGEETEAMDSMKIFPRVGKNGDKFVVDREFCGFLGFA
jgi:hypothetical protein